MPRVRNSSATPSRCGLGVQSLGEPVGIAAATADRGGHEVFEPHTGHFDGVLHRDEQAARRALPRRQTEQLVAVDGDRTARHRVLGATHQRVRQRRLAGAVRPHERVDLARRDLEVDAAQDLLTVDAGVQPGDAERAHDSAPGTTSITSSPSTRTS